MNERPEAPVTAAVDGTEASLRALDWAADEARLRGRRLRIVYAFDWPLYHRVPAGIPNFSVDDLARSIVEEARVRAEERVPGLRTEADFKVGDAAPVLLTEAARAELAVIGSRGLSRLGSLMLGSTGVELAASARCPVVVVPDREPEPPTGRVVLGVDGSQAAAAAAEWAFAAGGARGAALRALTAHGSFSHGRFGGSETPLHRGSEAAEFEAAAAEARRMLSESLAGLRERYPQVEVEESAVPGHPARVLIDASENADVLVVGSRGLGGFKGMLLGSVSQSLLTHGTVPTAVVRADTR
ncbi:universal stress protein [Nocardiopsis halophila]|uniref:universal stress protein n=1 Tax=Nocardiopsis halophila TaxID=141692 RepID=UPI000475BD26|nr:universal stress protein [Nocardiopsis halophila]